MAAASETGQRGKTWKESEVRALLDLMKEETITFNLHNAKTPKEKRSGHSVVQVQLEMEVRFSFIRVLLSLLLQALCCS